MLRTKAYFFTALSEDTALATALGSGEIVDQYPDVIETFPLVVYQDDNQTDGEYADNQPMISRARVVVHIFTKATIGYPTTTTLGILVANVFKGLFFHCVSNGETPDDSVGVRHRVMIFSRELFPSEM